MKNHLTQQDGFTLVELIIAMALTTFLVLIITFAIVQLFHIYEAIGSAGTTQKQARLVLDEITRDARDKQVLGVGPGKICFFSNPSSSSPTPGTSIIVGGGVIYSTSPTLSGGAPQVTTPNTLYRFVVPDNTTIGASCTQPLGPGIQPLTPSSKITSSDVSLAQFNVTGVEPVDPNSGLGYGYLGAEVDIAVATSSEVPSLIVTGMAPNVTVSCPANDQYCSVTDVSTAIDLKRSSQ